MVPGAVSIAVPVVMATIFAKAGSDMVRDVEATRTTAAHLGIALPQFRAVGGLQLAGAAGLLVGFAAPVVGVVAGVCLALLMAGALTSHLRAHDRLVDTLPAVVCLLGAAAAAAVAAP